MKGLTKECFEAWCVDNITAKDGSIGKAEHDKCLSAFEKGFLTAVEHVSDKPKDMRPVLAKITGQDCLGMPSWFEVVYFDEETGHWKSFSGSDTFKDCEQVIDWRYADECF